MITTMDLAIGSSRPTAIMSISSRSAPPIPSDEISCMNQGLGVLLFHKCLSLGCVTAT